MSAGLVFMRVPSDNDATAKTLVSLIKNNRLARCYRALWLAENDFTGFIACLANDTRLVGLTIAGFGMGFQRQPGWCTANPVYLFGQQGPGVQQGVVGALSYHQHVPGKILVEDVPRQFVAALS